MSFAHSYLYVMVEPMLNFSSGKDVQSSVVEEGFQFVLLLETIG